MKIFLIVSLYICGIYKISAMEYQEIGVYKIPSIGLGTFTVTDEQILTDTINAALELGYRHIDTSSAYKNEHIIGKVLKEWITSGKIKREDLFITTKLGSTELYPEEVKNALNRSLRKLQLDYVDLFLINTPIAMKIVEGKMVPQTTDLISVYKKMEEEAKAGKIKSLGLSNVNISQIQRVQAIAKIQPTNVQVECNLYFQQRELREFCQKHKITVTAFSPLGSPGMNNFFATEGLKPTKLNDILNDKVVTNIAEKHNKTNAQIALRFLVQSKVIAIPKSSNQKRLTENINVFDYTLSKKDMRALKKLDKGEEGRVVTFEELDIPNIKQHPEYPF